jgi:hypothetical protein
MHMSEETALIRRIARDLRYRSLDELINRAVTINQLDSVEKDISAALSDMLPQGCKYVEAERQFLEGAMVKYGIIDVTFAAPERMLNSRDEGGISLLKDLGFIDEVDKEDHADSSELFVSDLSCLELLAEGLEKRCTLIKLILLSEGQDTDWSELLKRIEGGSLRIPEGYLPRLFQVEDACITNSDFAWFKKHLYL